LTPLPIARSASARLFTTLGLLLAATLVAVAPTSPASAVAGNAGYLNLWQDHGYGGHLEYRKSYDKNFGNDECCGFLRTFDDRASSMTNRTGNYWFVHRDSNMQGPYFCIRPYSKIYNLADYGWGDRISSVLRASNWGSSRPPACTTVYGVRY
jgi:hypothetical protein